jgi:hypothetical protein
MLKGRMASVALAITDSGRLRVIKSSAIVGVDKTAVVRRVKKKKMRIFRTMVVLVEYAGL